MSDQAYLTRRDALRTAACGFGGLALAASAHDSARAAQYAADGLHHAPRARRVIFLFMQGGPSQVDTFDYKPRLARDDGQTFDFHDARRIANSGEVQPSSHRLMRSPWSFAQHGECGQWVSELFPETARRVDDLCFLHGLHTEGVAHGPATLFLHCGATNLVRPSVGSWITYGLGTENENLPGFVTIGPSGGNGGPRNYSAAFLPPVYQGTALGRAGAPAAEATIRNLSSNRPPVEQARRLELMRRLDAEQAARHPDDAELEAMIEARELAARMQAHAPDVLDLSGETAGMLAAYGIGETRTDDFGRRCLLARRLAEAGVRYIQVTYGDNTANPAWDQHSDLPRHAEHAAAVDRPVAALLADLKSRGLLEDTLVWWGGEFGRTPYAENNGTGRDHNPGGFTAWLAGGGVRPGTSFGATDEFGHLAVEGRVHVHDLHATILHLLGIDHERLTYRHDGRDFRLTDVQGRVVQEIVG